MKNLLFISLIAALTFTQETTSYSWEDGTGTILGSYGNLANPANVGTTSGISPHDGSRMLTVSESPISGTPQAFIAWVTDLSAGQNIEACFYGYDNTPGSAPSLRVWGSWTPNDDIDSYQGSADGNDDYTAGTGWDQVCHTFSTNQENWNAGEALVIQARLYSSSSGPDPTVYFIDLVEVTAPNSATVLYPGGASDGCTNPTACNYNPFATDDDGSCIYPTDMSIYDIQYTTNQGDYCYESDYSGTCVRTTGTVTAESPTYSNFYIQDESSGSYAGIYVHSYPSAPPTIGQNITITAMVNEYYSLTQLIDGASYSVNSSGNSVDITDISTGDLAGGCSETGESVESMLVRINNVVVTQASNEYGEWYVDDGSGPCKIDDKIFDGEWLDPSTSQEFESIVGVVDYAYSEFSIFPRTMSDFNLCSTCPVADAGDNQGVSPGVTVTLDGSSSYDPNGSIIAYEWTQLSGTAVTLSDEEAAITTFTSPNSNGSLTFKLSVFDNDFNEATDEIVITISSPITIQDIQYTTVQGEYCYESEMDGETVTVTGVITAVESVYPSFFIQDFNFDTYSGIYARSYQNTIPGDWSPVIGDEVTVSGTVSEYYSFTQLEPLTSYLVNSEGNNLEIKNITTFDLYSDPDAPSTETFCSEAGEAVEGMLVRISNVTVVKEANEYGEWYVDDGSGPCAIDDGTNTSPLYNGDWLNPTNGDTFDNIVGVVTYGYNRFRILPRDINDFNSSDCPTAMGDLNGDGGFNVLDIVTLANCILAENCGDGALYWDGLDCGDGNCYGCAGDINGDGGWNVLDIVTLANCVLADNCGGRIDDASSASLIINENHLSIEGDGFIGGVQMTLAHGSDFSIEMTDKALFADYLTTGNTTRLLVITPETEKLFSFKGEFEITELIVANSQDEIPTSMPTIFSLSSAYPNPFNPVTRLSLTIPDNGNVNVQVYNLHGQIVSTLLSGHKPANTYSLVWDASNVPSGMYFVRAEVGGFSETQKLMLIK